MPVRATPVIAVIVVLILAVTSLFTINEAQVALRTEFGAIVGLDYSPGLHFKWPWDQVVKFDRRILSLSYTAETFLTNDNRGLIVDFYVKWRVKDASRYFQATGGPRTLPVSVWPRSSRTASRAWSHSVRSSRSFLPNAPQSPATCSVRQAATSQTWGSSSSTCACSASICPMMSVRASTRA